MAKHPYHEFIYYVVDLDMSRPDRPYRVGEEHKTAKAARAAMARGKKDWLINNRRYKFGGKYRDKYAVEELNRSMGESRILYKPRGYTKPARSAYDKYMDEQKQNPSLVTPLKALIGKTLKIVKQGGKIVGIPVGRGR